MFKRIRSFFSEQKRATRAYRRWIVRLPVQENQILIDQENGLALDGNMYWLMRELLTNEEYAGYSVFFAVAQDNREEFAKRLERGGLLPMLVTRGTREYMHALASSKYLLTDNTFPACLVKREGQVMLNTWHGIPLKTLGRSEKTDLTRCGNVQRNFALSDYLVFPNRDMERLFVRDYMLRGLCHAQVIRCGYPRNEAFLVERPKEDTVKRYAWLPTFRGVGNSRGKEPKWLVPALEELDSLLCDNEVLYLKLHAVQQAEVDFSHFKHIVPMPTNEELYEVLAQCDGLLTDYSSVMFDFVLGGCKVVLWVPDKDAYALERGTYTSLDTLPFPVVSTAKEAVQQIRSQKSYDDAKLVEWCWPEQTKGASQLLLKTVLGNAQLNTARMQQTKPSSETLVYSELQGDLENLVTCIESCATEGPVRLAFPWACGVGREGFLTSLPNEVELTPLVGELLLSTWERIALALHRKTHLRLFLAIVDAIYALDQKRLFGSTTFKKVVVHDGTNPRWAELFRWMTGGSFLCS